MFLAKLRATSTPGKDSTFAILFDMNKLFEEFVFELLKKNMKPLCIQELVPQKRKTLITGYKDIGETSKRPAKIKSTYADLCILFKSGISLIIDTKYKLIKEMNDDSVNLSNNDIYQILAYRLIHTHNNTPPYGALLYPQNESPIEKEYFVGEKEKSFYVFTIDLSKNLQSEEMQIVKSLQSIFARMGAYSKLIAA